MRNETTPVRHGGCTYIDCIVQGEASVQSHAAGYVSGFRYAGLAWNTIQFLNIIVCLLILAAARIPVIVAEF